MHGGVERTRRADYRKGLGGTGAACVLHASLPNAGRLVIPQNGGIAPVRWLHTKTLELQQATKRKHAMCALVEQGAWGLLCPVLSTTLVESHLRAASFEAMARGSKDEMTLATRISTGAPRRRRAWQIPFGWFLEQCKSRPAYKPF
ncbi:hypothetical protein CPAR01_11737 [Colletotrichum paranaense]|uniref:Uncharacterized protein n=1 Tax=Colletotrichum paranaense TaxID=1914294 RepID=A0ABQ9S7Z9_9PEZI|nr:uncharacterized protein CPAR01_11737 [Colletotrichum paranaense]KAK1529425.1 hypothetical protein CPAR01_11737 [Colletotrichum paranaense]